MIKEYELQLWEAIKSRDKEAFLQLVAEDAVMVCGGFRCMGKEYAEEIKTFDIEKYNFLAFEVVYESAVLCQIHYVVETFVSNPVNNDLCGIFHVTSTWAKKNDTWKLIFNMDSLIIES